MRSFNLASERMGESGVSYFSVGFSVFAAPVLKCRAKSVCEILLPNCDGSSSSSASSSRYIAHASSMSNNPNNISHLTNYMISPTLHHYAALFKEVGPFVGSFNLAACDVCQSHFSDVS